MKDKVKILSLSGDIISLAEWQQKYGLSVGSDRIGKFFSLSESRFQRDLAEFGELVVCEPHMIVSDRFREKFGPYSFSSYNRVAWKQEELRKKEEKENEQLPPEARFEILAKTTSPHEVKMAGDADMKTRADVKRGVILLREAADEVNVVIRIGWKEYIKKSEAIEKAFPDRKEEFTFIHFDTCPEFFAKGKPFHGQPHPPAWEYKIEW